MRIKTIAWIFNLMLLSCGKEEISDSKFWQQPIDLPKVEVDSELKPILDQFMIDAKSYGLDESGLSEMSKLVFADPNAKVAKNLVGLCSFYSARDKLGNTIQVWWTVAIKLGLEGCYRKFVVYHELGHCVYRLDHSSNPEALMYPIVNTNENDCQMTWNHRVSDLFQSIAKF